MIYVLEGILLNYCELKHLQYVFLAMDGVPHKAKMMEQRIRKYNGAVLDECKRLLADKHRPYLE